MWLPMSPNALVPQCTFSMLEIYNEQVRDLLVAKSCQGGLAVREDTKEGRFVVRDLSTVQVGSVGWCSLAGATCHLPDVTC